MPEPFIVSDHTGEPIATYRDGRFLMADFGSGGTSSRQEEAGSGLAFRGSQQDGASPLSSTCFGDLLGFVGRETDSDDDAAALSFRQWWPSGSRIHASKITGHRKFAKPVDSHDFRGHNKDMNFWAIVTYRDGRIDRNNGCRTLAHAEAFLKFAASRSIVSVQVINRKGEIVRSAS